MPEGPEVQVLVDQLNAEIAGQKIMSILYPDRNWRMGKKKSIDRLELCVVDKIERKAKYLIFSLHKQNENFWILNHLAMTGSWFFRDLDNLMPIHTRLSFVFENGRVADFIDIRKWGKLTVLDSEEFFAEKIQRKLSSFGPDPLVTTISPELLFEAVKKRTDKHPDEEIKHLLMEQSFLSGIGNIYASEICWLANVNPFRKISTLTAPEIQNLAEAIMKVMLAAHRDGGSTIKTFKNAHGEKGRVQHYVYNKKFCVLHPFQPIIKAPQNGRTTHWCPKCQEF